ncbi:MAG: arginine deiminase-related protein [bacterium]
MNELQGRYAVVRGVARSYDRCIRPPGSSAPIDVNLARAQHDRYSATLESLGLKVILVEPDDAYPDCCFVEDTAAVIGDTAVILNPGAASRAGERSAVRALLERYLTVREITAPATIDGGDILRVGDRFFVGLSGRTNHHGAEAFERLVREKGYKSTTVELTGILHLKSACTHIGGEHLLVAGGYFDESIFCNYQLIHVSKKDEYSANCVAVNGKVILIAGYPQTKAAVEAAGFETVELEMSEFKKGGGSLTCLSIIF